MQINWDEYVGHYILGARHYLLKEKPESLPQARILLHRLYLLDKLVSILVYGLLFWLIYSYWNDIIYSFETILDTTSGFINQRFIKNKIESIWWWADIAFHFVYSFCIVCCIVRTIDATFQLTWTTLHNAINNCQCLTLNFSTYK